VKLEHTKHLHSRQTSNVVVKEISRELHKAYTLAEVMRKRWKLQWPDVKKYVLMLPKCWSDLGEEMDLSFLADHRTIQ
jgi:hypothetical protein